MRLISDHDVNEFLLGRHDRLHSFLGAHLLKNEKGIIVSTEFTVYAPNAKEVRLVGEFNQYEGINQNSSYGFF